ncbi:MAG: hypothetical protein ACLFV5_00155 [Anaerolineales bacterium]
MVAIKGLFLMNLSIVGIVLALAIYQVPQPWRGILVAWLLFLAPAGTFALRLLRHHYQYRKLRLEQDPKGRLRAAKGKAKEKRSLDTDGKLKVVHAEGGGRGRHTI